jgi:hypothetical protein
VVAVKPGGYDRLVGDRYLDEDRSTSMLAGVVAAQYTTVILVLTTIILLARFLNPLLAAIISLLAVWRAYRRPLAYSLLAENTRSFHVMMNYLLITLGLIAVVVMAL